MNNPASQGLLRAHARIATATIATAIASKLVNAWTITSGESAANHAAQMRVRAVSAVAQTTTSQNSARPSATRLKNKTTLSAPGMPNSSCNHCQPCAACAAAYM